jgi:hypothetical protein
MRRPDPQHGQRISALLGGIVAVLAVILLSRPFRGRARRAGLPGQTSTPSARETPTAAPVAALHRVTAAAGGGADLLTRVDGNPAEARPSEALALLPAGDSPGVATRGASASSGSAGRGDRGAPAPRLR